MAPYRPAEPAVPGRRYVVFDIPEKQTKVGVQICYDLNFPEISRNETLMGAEVLVKLTMDPTELYQINKPLHFARATENQAYLVSTNGVGQFESFHLYGNSLVIDPEGHLLWEAGEQPAVATVTLDLDRVSQVRRHGSLMMDHYLQHLRDYDFPQPFAGSVSEAPLFRQLPPTPGNLEVRGRYASAGNRRSRPGAPPQLTPLCQTGYLSRKRGGSAKALPPLSTPGRSPIPAHVSHRKAIVHRGDSQLQRSAAFAHPCIAFFAGRHYNKEYVKIFTCGRS